MKTVTFNLPDELADNVQALSVLNGETKNSILLKAISQYIVTEKNKLSGGKTIISTPNGDLKEVIIK